MLGTNCALFSNSFDEFHWARALKKQTNGMGKNMLTVIAMCLMGVTPSPFVLQRADAELLREGVVLERLGLEWTIEGREVLLLSASTGDIKQRRALPDLPADSEAAAAQLAMLVRGLIEAPPAVDDATLLAYVRDRAIIRKQRGQDGVVIGGKRVGDWAFAQRLADAGGEAPSEAMRVTYAPEHPRSRGLLITGYAVGGGLTLNGFSAFLIGQLYKGLACGVRDADPALDDLNRDICRFGKRASLVGLVGMGLGAVGLISTGIYHGSTDRAASPQQAYYPNDERRMLVERYNALLRDKLGVPEHAERELEPVVEGRHAKSARVPEGSSWEPNVGLASDGVTLVWTF